MSVEESMSTWPGPSARRGRETVLRRRPWGGFYVVRLPLLLIGMLSVILGLGLGGWHYYRARPALTGAGQLQQRLRDNLDALDSYYARFETRLIKPSGDELFQIELWKSGDGLYRMETARLAEERPAEIQVVVFDGSRDYLYNHELGDFFPINDPGGARMPYLILEDYWRSLVLAPQFNLVAEKSGSRHSYYRVEVVPERPHRDRVREAAWLEAKSLLPVRIEFYDLFDSMTQVIIFDILKINPVLEATLFQVQAGPRAPLADQAFCGMID